MLEPHLRPRWRDAYSESSSRLVFPQLSQCLDPRFFNSLTQHPFLEDEPVPPTSLEDEMIRVPEHLIPVPEDLQNDTLPVEQHPSYPLGNPYWIHHAPHTLQPVGSSQPKLDPRVCSHLSVHSAGNSIKEALSAVAGGSVHAKSAVEAREDSDAVPYSIDPDGQVHLAPHLQLRARIGSTIAPPAWPFKRFGPGSHGRSYAALFHVPKDLHPEVSVWADLALEELVPRARPDSYTLPASLVHPYTQPVSSSSGRERRRTRPSGIPSTLGLRTRRRDDEWLEGEDSGEAHSDSDLDHEPVEDTSFERELEEWATSDVAMNPDSASTAHPPHRRISSVWMQQQHEFRRAILSVFAQRDTWQRQKRQRPDSASPPPPPTSASPRRRKRRSLGVPPAPPLPPILPESRDGSASASASASTHAPPALSLPHLPETWVWGRSRSLRDPAL